jgi:hypothetical protein
MVRSRRSCLPRNARRHTTRPEEPPRNRSIGFVGEACIKRAEDEHQSLTPRGREAIRRASRAIGQSLPEAARSISARGKIRVEGDDRCDRRLRRSTANEYDGCAVVRTGDDPVFSIACRMQDYLG